MAARMASVPSARKHAMASDSGAAAQSPGSQSLVGGATAAMGPGAGRSARDWKRRYMRRTGAAQDALNECSCDGRRGAKIRARTMEARAELYAVCESPRVSYDALREKPDHESGTGWELTSVPSTQSSSTGPPSSGRRTRTTCAMFIPVRRSDGARVRPFPFPMPHRPSLRDAQVETNSILVRLTFLYSTSAHRVEVPLAARAQLGATVPLQ